jgi:hypothetical protein
MKDFELLRAILAQFLSDLLTPIGTDASPPSVALFDGGID